MNNYFDKNKVDDLEELAVLAKDVGDSDSEHLALNEIDKTFTLAHKRAKFISFLRGLDNSNESQESQQDSEAAQ